MPRYSSLKSFDYAPAKKSLGQNFLTDDSVIEQIIATLGDLTDKSVVEIGPGRGALTRPLIESGANLTVIELDNILAARLQTDYKDVAEFQCLNANILDIDISTISSNDTIIIGNLPYYISTAIIRHLIAYRSHLKRIVLMLQREVADRIAAQPGESERGFLTVMVEQYLTITKEFDVAPTAFSPRPKVWSSIVSLEPRRETIIEDKKFESLVSAAFAQKRKTILNNLKRSDPNIAETLAEASIESQRRAETLTRDEWMTLFDVWTKKAVV